MHKFSFFSSFEASDRFIISIAIMLASYDDERVYIKNKRDFTTGDIDDARYTTRTQQKGITASRVKGIWQKEAIR